MVKTTKLINTDLDLIKSVPCLINEKFIKFKAFLIIMVKSKISINNIVLGLYLTKKHGGGTK